MCSTDSLYGCIKCPYGTSIKGPSVFEGTWIIYENNSIYDIYSDKYRLSFVNNTINIIVKTGRKYRDKLLSIDKNDLSYSSFKNSEEIDRFVEEVLIFG
jgi:hypothetical protein